MDLIKLYKKNTIRIGAIQVVTAVVFIYLLLGIFYRQIIQYDYFSQRGRQQCVRRIIIPAIRGNIYDRNGKLLVGNRPLFSLELYLNELKDNFCKEFLKRVKYYTERDEKFDRKVLYTEVRESVVNNILKPIGELLNRELFLSGEQINRQLFRRSLLPITLINELTLEEYDKLINYLSINSPVQIRAGSTRFYPNDQLACHVLGYTVLEENHENYNDHIYTFSTRQQNGKTGVEKSANEVLRGSNGFESWLVLPTGEKRSLEERIETRNGDNIFLSIDSELQCIAENALERYVGSVVVIDVRTGEVLVMANSPAYNPNALYPKISTIVFNEINERFAWLNQAIQSLFPPGSVFKLLSAISFLKSENFNPDEKLVCNGIFYNGTHKMRCNNHRYGEEIDLHLAIGKSCNTYIFDRAAKLGGKYIALEAKNYGLDRPTSIDLPFETQGMIIPDADWKRKHGLGGWSRGDTLNLSIGQGYTLVTPLGLCCFTASLATNRQYIIPTIFRRDESFETKFLKDKTYLSDDVYYYVLDSMIDCVEKYTGRRAKLGDIVVAGKTGSAQFKENGKKRNIAWFSCFAPAYDPEIAVTVMIREDRDDQNYHGGSEAAPIARLILRKYFNLN